MAWLTVPTGRRRYVRGGRLGVLSPAPDPCSSLQYQASQWQDVLNTLPTGSSAHSDALNKWASALEDFDDCRRANPTPPGTVPSVLKVSGTRGGPMTPEEMAARLPHYVTPRSDQPTHQYVSPYTSTPVTPTTRAPGSTGATRSPPTNRGGTPIGVPASALRGPPKASEITPEDVVSMQTEDAANRIQGATYKRLDLSQSPLPNYQPTPLNVGVPWGEQLVDLPLFGPVRKSTAAVGGVAAFLVVTFGAISLAR